MFERRLNNQTPEEFVERYQAKDVVSNASVVVYEAPRHLLFGARRALVKKSYIVPWEGKIARPAEEIA